MADASCRFEACPIALRASGGAVAVVLNGPQLCGVAASCACAPGQAPRCQVCDIAFAAGCGGAGIAVMGCIFHVADPEAGARQSMRAEVAAACCRGSLDAVETRCGPEEGKAKAIVERSAALAATAVVRSVRGMA